MQKYWGQVPSLHSGDVTLSKHGAGGTESAKRVIMSAYDDPGTPEEVTRRTFMANATLTIGGIIGVALAIPLVGSLLPLGAKEEGKWTPLTEAEFADLQKAAENPVKLSFNLTAKDSYLPSQTSENYVWGIKTDEAAFKKARPDVYDNPKSAVAYPAINMNFVIFSPICPHLGCRFNWKAEDKKFECPCHGSQFTFEGEHVSGPANRGLDPLPLREQSGKAEIQWVRYAPTIGDRIVISYVS